ncbi:MAG: hypothetical protein V1703_00150 [Candidatus Altiarchaeota archaeon]
MKGILVILVVLVLLAAGCICCSTNGSKSTTTVKKTTTIPMVCNKPYLVKGSECCLDINDNKICDSEETTTVISTTTTAATSRTEATSLMATTQATTTTQATMTTVATTTTVGVPQSGASYGTTTTAVESCSDGVKNQDESSVDCGGVCQSSCNIVNLTLSGGALGFQGYSFRLKDSQLKTQAIEYTIEIKTPDGYKDERTMNSGDQSWIDSVKFKIEGDSEVRLKTTLWIDSEMTSKAPENSTIFTLGGQSCVQLGGGVCTRNYFGYEVTMVNRVDEGGGRTGVKIKVRQPDGAESIGIAYQNGPEYYVSYIAVGVLRYMIPGGYSNIYVRWR